MEESLKDTIEEDMALLLRKVRRDFMRKNDGWKRAADIKLEACVQRTINLDIYKADTIEVPAILLAELVSEDKAA